MREEWVAILLTALVLVAALAVLVQLVLRALRQKGEPLPSLPNQRVLFPVGACFPANDAAALEEALALVSTGSSLVLALLYEVPRATALEQAAPAPEDLALLEALQQLTKNTETVIHPCRSALEELLKLAANPQTSALFVRLDTRMENDPTAALLRRTPCALYLSHSHQ